MAVTGPNDGCPGATSRPPILGSELALGNPKPYIYIYIYNLSIYVEITPTYPLLTVPLILERVYRLRFGAEGCLGNSICRTGSSEPLNQVARLNEPHSLLYTQNMVI